MLFYFSYCPFLTSSRRTQAATSENLCLFMSIVIDKKYQDGKAVILLTQALLDKINSYAKKGIYIKQMLAECVSEDGRRYITKTFNGKKITNGKNGEIYLCILDAPSSF